jgi:hypothetical protein
MSELTTLHPFDSDFVAQYVAALRGDAPTGALLPAATDRDWVERELDRARQGYVRARQSSEAGANAITFSFARLLSAAEPVFFVPGAGFSQLEARFDRGAGMLLRPPSRLFADAGLDIVSARAMPIRLDLSGGIMGGAYMPPAQVSQFHDLLERRLDRLARRVSEAELDAPALLGVLLEASAYAAERELGLYEAVDVIVPGVPESLPPGLRLIAPDRKRLERPLRQRLEEASRPPKEPGLLTRLFKRGVPASRVDDPGADQGRPWRGMSDVTPPPDPDWQVERREGRVE